MLSNKRLLFFLWTNKMLTAVVSAQSKSPPYLTFLPRYEAERRSALTVVRRENVDVVLDNDDNTNIAYCHFVEMNRHSLMAGPDRITFPTDFPLEALAAVALATEHLNRGDGSVIPEIAQIMPTKCPNLRFTTEFLDTAGLELEAVDSVMQLIQRETSPQEQLPCAFLGAFRSAVSIATALYTSLNGYPQMSTLSSAALLDDKSVYPLFGRLVPSDYAVPLLEYWTNELNLQHVALVHTDSATGISYSSALRKAVAESYPHVTLQTVAFPDTTTEFGPTVAALKATGVRYIFAVISTTSYENLILEAYRQGIAGTGVHNWMVSNKAIPITYLENREFAPDDPLFLASQGILVFDTSVGSLQGVGRYDAYIEKWQQLLNPQDMAYLQTKVPTHPEDPGFNPVFSEETFSIGRFTGATAAIYDATVTLGLAACRASSAEENDDFSFDGPSHYAAILNTSFVGASGRVSLEPATGSRTSVSNLYVFTNAVVNDVPNSPNVTLTEERTHIFDEKWIEVQAPIFNDGTTTPPLDLPPVTMDYNYIGTGLRAAGLALAGLVMAFSLGFAVWTLWNGSKYVVKASQPIFLHLICFGTMLMGASLVPLTLDDEVVSDISADRACATFPWLLSLGWCFSFSALFSKTKRINKIFHNPRFRRLKVEVKDVIRPMVILLFLHVAILAVWTAVSPLQWSREITGIDRYNRAVESQGECRCDHFWAFAGPLIAIDLGVLVYSIQQAYTARKIATEFAESEWIFRAMSFIMIVSFVGIPVFIIAEEEPRASYFVLCAIIFVVSTSLLFFIFVPKVLLLKNGRTHKETMRSTLNNLKANTDSYTVSGASMASEASEGAEILEHPKLQADLYEELKRLKETNITLEKKITELEKPSTEEPAQAMSETQRLDSPEEATEAPEERAKLLEDRVKGRSEGKDAQGAESLEHPKLQADLHEELKSLKEANKILDKNIAELEKPTTEEPAQAMSETHRLDSPEEATTEAPEERAELLEDRVKERSEGEDAFEP